MATLTQPPLFLAPDLSTAVTATKPMKFPPNPAEWRIVALRECPSPDALSILDTPAPVADYWFRSIPSSPMHNPEVECFVVLILNTRRKCRGHFIISTGTIDTILVSPSAVFRPAIIANASAIILMHNHPSGDPTPSEADIKVTRDLIRAGQLLKIEVLDHVVMGHKSLPKPFCSLRELGYFF